ncbi:MULTISPECIES: hypothetical protein [Kitasatospora]|nr:hypothetical protein [Kitasatospora sp. GP30]MDH6143585.1 hypothetical protein [Kitasatospora sp. GP30]
MGDGRIVVELPDLERLAKGPDASAPSTWSSGRTGGWSRVPR